MKPLRTWGWLVAPLLALNAGCFVISDVLNPSLAGQFGLAGPGDGAVVVVWTNDSDFPATFSVLWTNSTSADSLVRNQLSTAVPTGEVQNAVIDCPLGFLRPAGVLDTGEPTGDLASAAVAVNGTTVTYTGATLVAGEDFSCGDVVEVRLIQTSETGDDDQMGEATFAIAITVVPGR